MIVRTFTLRPIEVLHGKFVWGILKRVIVSPVLISWHSKVTHATIKSEACIDFNTSKSGYAITWQLCTARTSSSITLLPTGTLKLQVREVRSLLILLVFFFTYLFSANTFQSVQKSLFNWTATQLERSWQAVAYISHVWHWKSLNLCCWSKPFDIFNVYQTI